MDCRKDLVWDGGRLAGCVKAHERTNKRTVAESVHSRLSAASLRMPGQVEAEETKPARTPSDRSASSLAPVELSEPVQVYTR